MFKIIQSGGILADLLAVTPQAMFLTGVTKGTTLAKNAAPELAQKAT